jgi:hypothetical protein
MKESILRGDRILPGDSKSLEHAPDYRYLIGWRRPLIKLDRFLIKKFKSFRDYFGFTFWLEIKEKMKGEDWIDDELA